MKPHTPRHPANLAPVMPNLAGLLLSHLKKILFALLLCTGASLSATLNESQVFEWWDNGIITADEASEILSLLEEENRQEACLLAEVYAQESCTPENSDSSQTETSNRPSPVPHGYVEWRGRTDSLGHLKSRRTEIRVNFYRYSLRLGSQSLLTYKNAGSESHFGQISTRELHSLIPLDTLWGAAALYPLGMFRIGAFLDTAATTRTSIGVVPSKGTEIRLAYWHRGQTTNITDNNTDNGTEHRSLSAQTKGSWGSIAAWWIPENKGDLPLTRLQLQHREKMQLATLTWNATAYAHGDSLPQQSRLSSTIAGSRFWGTQTMGVTIHDPWKSKLAANARTIIPLEGDTSKTRFKAIAESGPRILRSTTSATCLSAEEHCRQNDLMQKIKSTYGQLTFTGKFRTRHTRGKGIGTPLYEAGTTYALDDFNSTGIAITIPKGNPAREIQVRTTAEIGTDYLQFSLVATFRRTAENPLHPLHAAIKAKCLF